MSENEMSCNEARELMKKNMGKMIIMSPDSEYELIDSSQVFNATATLVHQTAHEKGWHDKPRSFGDVIALCHSELSEALEEYRNGVDPSSIYYKRPDGKFTSDQFHTDSEGNLIPNKVEGPAAELADVIIRIFDLSGPDQFNIPVVEAMFQKMLYNGTREYRHGNKAL